MTWVAYTEKEGRWPFTAAASPEQAIHNLCQAIREMRVLSIPVGNPVTTVHFNEYDRAFLKRKRHSDIEGK